MSLIYIFLGKQDNSMTAKFKSVSVWFDWWNFSIFLWKKDKVVIVILYVSSLPNLLLEKMKIYCLVSAKERNNNYCLINNQLWLACHTWCRNQVSKNNKRVEIQSINAANHFSMIDMLSMWYDWHVDRPWQWLCMVSLPPMNRIMH